MMAPFTQHHWATSLTPSGSETVSEADATAGWAEKCVSLRLLWHPFFHKTAFTNRIWLSIWHNSSTTINTEYLDNSLLTEFHTYVELSQMPLRSMAGVSRQPQAPWLSWQPAVASCWMPSGCCIVPGISWNRTRLLFPRHAGLVTPDDNDSARCGRLASARAVNSSHATMHKTSVGWLQNPWRCCV